MKFPIKQLVVEHYEHGNRYSHPAYIRKLEKGINPTDFDSEKKIIEVEYEENGNRVWYALDYYFGIAIKECAERLKIIHTDEKLESLQIVGFSCFKIKRTNYIKLIFQGELPF